MREEERRTSSEGRRGRRTAAAVCAIALGVGVTACGPSLSLVTAPWGESRAVIKSALFGDKSVTFDKAPKIKVDNGRIESVTVTGPKGNRVGGRLVDNGAAWELDTSDLEFGTKYQVSATAVDLRGVETSTTNNFRTFEPEKVLEMESSIENGEKYGVGMPITLTFNLPVKHRKAIEERLRVTTPGKDVVGAWSWEGNQSVTYRPREYWPADTTVELDADVKGVNAGDDVYALENLKQKFRIGARMILEQDSALHRMIVKKNGKVIRRIPTSTGKPGYETRSGIKVIMSKEPYVVMDAASLGVSKNDPDYYRLEVYNAMRVTYSGEYIHSAPWSVGSQGWANVSHGCINVSPENAAWLMRVVKVGDVFVVKNTGVKQDPGNGITVWNESWQEWLEGSALAS